MAISHVILKNMAYLPIKELSDNQIANLQRQLTIYNRYNTEDILELYDIQKDYFGIPLYFYKNHSNISNNVIDKRVQGFDVRFDMISKPYPDQARVLDEFRIAIEDDVTGFILNAQPGWGKTRTMIEMLQIIGKNSLIVVPKSDLVDQWVERILQHTNLKKEDIGIFNAGRTNYTKEKKISVGLVHTLALSRYHKYSKDFGVVAFDEVHASVPPKTFAPVAQMYSPKYRIGASATLKRDDGFDKAFHYHVEQLRLVGDASTNRMSATVYAVDYPKSSGNIPAYAAHDPIKARATAISLFAKNRDRTQFIAKAVQKSIASGRRTCVISDRTSILFNLYNILTKESRVKPEDVGYFCSSLTDINGNTIRSVPKAEVNRTLQASKIILSTYGLMSTGTDIKDLATIILATPQSKVTQTKGRIERVCAGKKDPVVMDIIDSYYPQAKMWASKRKKEYDESSMAIKHFSYESFIK